MSLLFFLISLGLSLAYEPGQQKDGGRQAEQTLKLGGKVYRESCMACHGEKGDGKGQAASTLKTKPRDFTSGVYKFRSTPTGSLPLDQDIVRTISRGVRGTSMLPQLHLSQQETWAVGQYLKTFSPRFSEQRAKQPVSIPPRPKDRNLVRMGERLYREAGCGSCHGPDGKGNGRADQELKDHWGFPIEPTNLTLKPFKSGHDPQDLYRTINTGLDGTPMPSYADALSPKEQWSLVLYILSIATHERPRGMMGLVGEETRGMMIDMRAAMAGMMGGRGMMGRGMMHRNMGEMMRDMMGR
ncbi:MAG: c-type cytochrome [Deltaproteobacteria bacterium]|nr:c-type cytochrome [Deltaproteobacteria bacterium]